MDETAPAQLKIRQGRHPVLDVALDTPVVPNDTELKAEGPCALVITGPNMGGKSCYIRQAALIAIMAQVGLPCTMLTCTAANCVSFSTFQILQQMLPSFTFASASL